MSYVPTMYRSIAAPACLLVLFGLLLTMGAAGSQAASVAYSDRTTWESVVGGGWVTETFTVGSNQQLLINAVNNVGGIINVQYTTTDGATNESSDFISAADGTMHLAWDNSAAIPDGETLTLKLTFDTPITAFGADVTTLDLGDLTNLKIQVDGTGPLFQLPIGAANSVNFFGLISDTPFTSLSFIDDGLGTGSRRFALDNASTADNAGITTQLLTPPDQDLSNVNTVTFTGTASAPAGLATATLLVGGPPLIAVATQSLSGTSSALSLTATLPTGTQYWNIEVEDVNGAKGRGATDFELTVDPSYPDVPVLVTPAAGSTGHSPGLPLAAWVSNPAGGTLSAQVALRKAPQPEFTIIALPDTQYYSQLYPAIFTNQTQWIVDNKVARNIVFVTHEGDVVQNNNVASEWQAANTSMSLLDGVVPYGIGPGNHDQPTSLYNQTFPWTRFAGESWYGGHYQSLNDNNYQLFSAGGLDFVIVHLEFCPPAGAVAWADGVYKAYPDRIGIMTTHGYLNEVAQRSVNSCTNTQYLWDGLAVPNPNLHFMLSGHVTAAPAESRRSDVLYGHPVHQMLADYQTRANGGNGWLRILRFVPAEDKVYVQTYSPWLNQYETDANSEFSLDFAMGAPFGDAGTVAAGSGTLAVLYPAGLEPQTEYEWQMTVTNGAGKSRAGSVLRFTTGANVPPPDADADSVPDSIDNCTLVSNASQCDSDGDRFGNGCDADLNNNSATNSQDYVLFRAQLGLPSVAPTYNAADLNCNGVVNSQDYVLFRGRLGAPSGPSALVP